MTLKLITAVLMTMAAIAWLASVLVLPQGEDTTMRWIIVALFAVMASVLLDGLFPHEKINLWDRISYG